MYYIPVGVLNSDSGGVDEGRCERGSRVRQLAHECKLPHHLPFYSTDFVFTPPKAHLEETCPDCWTAGRCCKYRQLPRLEGGTLYNRYVHHSMQPMSLF